MSKFSLHYVHPDGERVPNLTECFTSLSEAREEATSILEEFVGGGSITSAMGFIEIHDENGACVLTVRFPEF